MERWNKKPGIYPCKNYVKKNISNCINFYIPGKSVQNFTDMNVHVCDCYFSVG